MSNSDPAVAAVAEKLRQAFKMEEPMTATQQLERSIDREVARFIDPLRYAHQRGDLLCIVAFGTSQFIAGKRVYTEVHSAKWYADFQKQAQERFWWRHGQHRTSMQTIRDDVNWVYETITEYAIRFALKEARPRDPLPAVFMRKDWDETSSLHYTIYCPRLGRETYMGVSSNRALTEDAIQHVNTRANELFAYYQQHPYELPERD